MAETALVETRPASEVVQSAAVSQASNGVCYAAVGEIAITGLELERLVGAVPRAIAAALDRKAFYFVPLAVSEGEQTLIAPRYDLSLSDSAVCHRNLNLGNAQCVFISTRLMGDRFSIAFEFFINVAHAFVERAGVSEGFSNLAWRQVEDKLRGETSLDAWELRRQATGGLPDAERARNDYFAAAFADAIAIYLLSLYLDLDYQELREREYPLLHPQAMADRLRKVNELFPPNSGYEFAIHFRRRP